MRRRRDLHARISWLSPPSVPSVGVAQLGCDYEANRVVDVRPAPLNTV